jgi:hypothetical protein
VASHFPSQYGNSSGLQWPAWCVFPHVRHVTDITFATFPSSKLLLQCPPRSQRRETDIFARLSMSLTRSASKFAFVTRGIRCHARHGLRTAIRRLASLPRTRVIDEAQRGPDQVGEGEVRSGPRPVVIGSAFTVRLAKHKFCRILSGYCTRATKLGLERCPDRRVLGNQGSRPGLSPGSTYAHGRYKTAASLH